MADENDGSDWELRYQEMIYAVSHDLGAPLRHIQAFSQLLLEEELDLTEEQSKWLTHIEGAGRLTRSLLDGLLRLSRVYTSPKPSTMLTLTEVFSELGLHVEAIPENRGVLGNFRDLEEAYTELTENAELYCGGSTTSVSFDDRSMSIAVIGCEPGMDDEQWAKACAPLQRLGLRVDSDHVGMGLPVTLAIVGVMGGEVRNSVEAVRIIVPLIERQGEGQDDQREH